MVTAENDVKFVTFVTSSGKDNEILDKQCNSWNRTTKYL